MSAAPFAPAPLAAWAQRPMPPFVRLGVARLESAPATLGQPAYGDAGVAHKGMRALRHPAGMRPLAETGDPETTARHLAHRTPDTVRVSATWSDRRLRETIGRW